MSSFKVEMIRINYKAMEKIMREIIVIVLWSSIIMIFNSCMPIDITESPYENENYAPKIFSPAPNPFIGVVSLPPEEQSITISVKITDKNESDLVTLGWYVKDANSPTPFPYVLSFFRRATSNENDISAIFTFEVESNKLVCGLNKVTLLVSDRGLKNLQGTDNEDTVIPYPAEEEEVRDLENAQKVKTDMMQWIIRKECI